jgi:hypothetical protein
MNTETKSYCLKNAIEIAKQAATHVSDQDKLAAIIETTYKKLVELAEDVQVIKE